MLNNCVLIGRLVRDPDLKYVGDGTPLCKFTIAVERGYTNKNGDKDVDFIPIVTWQKLAEIVAQNLNKGRLVAVQGRLQISKNKKEDRTYINPEIVANDVRFLDYADNSQSSSNEPEDIVTDEELDMQVPF